MTVAENLKIQLKIFGIVRGVHEHNPRSAQSRTLLGSGKSGPSVWENRLDFTTRARLRLRPTLTPTNAAQCEGNTQK